MKLEDLIERFRLETSDTAEPYLWPDELVTAWLNDALDEACIRGRLIREDANTDVCEIELTQGQQTYPLHSSLYEIIEIRRVPLVGRPEVLKLVSREQLDRAGVDWRYETRQTCYAIQDDTSIRFVGGLTTGDMIHMDVYRLPLDPIATDSDEPEIHRAHHVHLLQWAYHKAYSVPDTEVFDPQRAAKAEDEFTRYFGIRPDSDLRRITREDFVQHNEPVLP